jgi:hypothetical protein
MWHPLSAKGGTNFTDKRRSLGRYSSLVYIYIYIYILANYVYYVYIYTCKLAARGTVVGSGIMLQDGRSPVRVWMIWFLPVYLILPVALWPWDISLWWSGTESTITEATTGLFYQPRMMMMMMMMMSVEQSVTWVAGETEVLGENLPQRCFVHDNSTWSDPCSNPGRRCGKPMTSRLSYGTAMTLGFTQALTEMRTRNLFLAKGGRLVRLTSWPPSVSRSTRQCGILDWRVVVGLRFELGTSPAWIKQFVYDLCMSIARKAPGFEPCTLSIQVKLLTCGPTTSVASWCIQARRSMCQIQYSLVLI